VCNLSHLFERLVVSECMYEIICHGTNPCNSAEGKSD
jgi:hypothetical protein